MTSFVICRPASNQLNVTLVCGPNDITKAIDGFSNIVAKGVTD
jgi:hypothetical protein